MADVIDGSSSGAASLDGYLYQLDVSVWTALDLVLAKKLANEIVLEPIGEEDLEADVSDDAPGAVTADVDLNTHRLVIQAKLRNTGPWKAPEIIRLLQHGTERVPAAKRLEDSRVRYLLVTSADLDGVARQIRVSNLGEWPKEADMPATIADVLPDDAGGRVAVLASVDLEKISWRLRSLLEDDFRVPHLKVEACMEDLRAGALARMRGAGHGIWTREELEFIVRSYDGYIASSAEIDSFVRPTNWDTLRQKLRDHYAVIITGASGTGKTTASLVLLDELRAEVPGLAVVPITQGPQQVRAYKQVGPVVFSIEDPWGRYRFEPQSEPWNDELDKLLSTATGNRWFVITSRSDVLAESHAKRLSKKLVVTLESENYGPRERLKLFRNRVPHLTRRFQDVAERYASVALNRLRSPLEIQKYFDNLAEGPADDENEAQYIERSIAAAHRDSIETTIVQQVSNRRAWVWAAVVWGLLKARPKQSRALLPQIQAGYGAIEQALEDGLDPFVNFLVNGRNLRQPDGIFSYYHPRVEAGLETAIEQKPGLAGRILRYLVQVLIGLDDENGNDWGRESAAHLIEAIYRRNTIGFKPTPESQRALDIWIAARLGQNDEEFGSKLSLAAAVGSRSSSPSDLARWLQHLSRNTYSFGDSWSPDPDDDDWYQRIATNPLTTHICSVFVRHVLPFVRERYPDDFYVYLDRLAPGLTPVFLEAANSIVTDSYNPNADVLAAGALRDIDAFEAIVAEAIAYQAKLASEEDAELWLALRNGEYGEDYAQHLYESAGEEGHTAAEFIDAYVHELRRKRGWPALRDHPQVSALLGAWIEAVRRQKAPPIDAELLAIKDLAYGHHSESQFWSLAGAQWREPFVARLLERLVAGHPEGEVRIAATSCFRQHIPAESATVVRLLLTQSPSRIVELALDVRAAHDSNDDTNRVIDDDPCIVPFLAALTDPLREICRAIIVRDFQAVLSTEAITILINLDMRANDEIRLMRAQYLAGAGHDIGDQIDILLRAEHGNAQEDIAVATASAELAVAQGLWSQVERALMHRFADVRCVALQALASRTTGVLPENLLVLAADKSSRMRRALLELLTSRRDPAHLDALIILAADNWTDQTGYYGEDASYPIALGAAELLVTSPDLPEHVLHKLFEIACTTNDSDVRDKLLGAIAKNGGREGRSRVFGLALSRENTALAIDASWALFHVSEELDVVDVSAITLRELAVRPPAVAVPMAMIVGRAAGSDQIIDATKSLITRPTRNALIVPLMVASAVRDATIAGEIGKLLPRELNSAMHDLFQGGPKLPRDALDMLGDVRIVAEVLRALPFLFIPKKKE